MSETHRLFKMVFCFTDAFDFKEAGFIEYCFFPRSLLLLAMAGVVGPVAGGW